MSFLSKTTTGFFGLGICSVTSLIIAHQYKAPLQPLAAPPATPIKVERGSVGESIQKLVKEENFKGCANLDVNNRGTSLYVCIKNMTDDSYLPFFFYFGRYDEDRFPQIKQVVKTVKTGSFPTIEAKLVKGGFKSINFYPPWLKNIANPNLTPEKDCQIITEADKKSTFTLRCSTKDVKKGIQI